MNTFTLRRSWLFHAGARVASAFTIASLVVTLAGPAFFAFPNVALAATSIFTESFGTGNSSNDVPGWKESEHPNDNDDDVIARKGESSGSDMKSPNDGRFLRIKGDDNHWACKKITTMGYQALVLKYYWRGEGEAENDDYGKVEVRANGTSESSCNSNDNGGWTPVASHPLDNSSNSNSNSQEDWALNSVSLPADSDGEFLLRFRNDSSSDGEYFRVDGIQIEGDPIPGTLIVKKVLVQDNGGTYDKDDFSFSVNNDDAVQFEADGQNDLSVAPGTYSVVETAVPGYTTTYDNCSNVQVASGQTVTCTITNNDKPAKLTVIKELDNTGGGTASKDDFKFQINDGEWNWFNENGTNVIELNAGTYTVEEDTVVNYATDYSNCTSVQLGIGQEATCTVYNTFVPPPPPQCNAQAPYTVVSNTSTLSDGNATVALGFIHAGWTASIPGATWIWSEEPLTDAASEVNEVFTKTFTISTGVPTGTVTLNIAADNAYEVDVNTNTNVCVDATEDNYSAAGQDTCTFPASYLSAGSNTLTFRVKNMAQSGGTQESNPAGLLYKLSYTVNECEEALSCNPEVNLVKNPSFETPIVTANGGTWELYANGTPLLEWMSSYLSGNTPSLIEIQRGYSGWLAADGMQFAELDSNEPTTVYQDVPTIPGKNYTFSYKFAARPDASTLADNTANVWWGGSLAGSPSSDTVSAGPNTDWKTYTHTVTATTSLTRVSFQDAGTANSLGNFVDQVSVTCQPEPPKSTVTICKYDTNENALSGWTMLLKGDHIEDLSVPTSVSTGSNSVNALSVGGSYIAVASGTWNNQGGANPVDAEYSTTDGWATQMDGYTGYQNDILELQINSAFDPNSNWGPYSSTHEYAQSFVQGVAGPANFRIFDGTGTTQDEGWFGDNSGTLAVSLYEGYAGVTGENGCVTFTDVPYGTYTVGELMKPNWQNESGLMQVTVDNENESFEVVNKDMTPPPAATVVAAKVMCKAEQYLPNWGDGAANITSTTAADWVAQSEGNCWLVENWTFEWAPSVATNPGDNVLTGGAGWTSFTGSASVPSGALLWLREQMPTGYVPFTGANTTQDVSAEFYCSTDVLNYDNFDWIDPVVGGQTYYCVGFNAPVETYEEEGGTLIIEKVTVGGDGEFTFGVEEVGDYEIQTVEGEGSVTIHGLDGTYDVVELVPEGWDLTSVVCEYDGESEGESIENGKTVYIDEGDTVTCTFTNTKDDEEEEEEEDEDDSPSTPSSTPPPSGGGNPNFASFGGGFGGSVLGASTGGSVLGASCGLYMDKFMRIGKKNDVEQVKKLQIFLNKELGLSIPVTGFFGPMTEAAVKQFQLKYAAQILTPWGITVPTGIVYQTTLRQINLLECPELALQLPPLVEWSKANDPAKPE